MASRLWQLSESLEEGKQMPILTLILVLVVIGVVLWLINTYIPMQPAIKTILNAVVVVILIIWLLAVLFPGLANIRVGK